MVKAGTNVYKAREKPERRDANPRFTLTRGAIPALKKGEESIVYQALTPYGQTRSLEELVTRCHDLGFMQPKKTLSAESYFWESVLWHLKESERRWGRQRNRIGFLGTRSTGKRGNALQLGTHHVTNCFKFVDMPRSGSGATVVVAEMHTRLCSSSSYFVRSISTFLRAASFEHIRNHAEARASTYSLSAAS